ncbi:SRPBCC family protein [Nocardioides sp. InS609-2]|uniref:SRPBCC family protein n=1 Tax=Nocardioides sp. InS609-2 TaxID=2760705 RepID=UPI0017961706|nr:SRPBCC family protein [Nocardioides sp. InS609-2]MBA3783891.1 SRPBCC family protein [Nocardioides sp.]
MIELGTGRATSTAEPQAYFERWVDHDSWPAWSPDTEWVRVEGPVRTGATGRLKPKGGPRVRFTISACEPGREYTDTTRLPGATLVFQHTAEATASGTELGVRVTLDGPLRHVWALVMRSGFEKSAQDDLDRLIRLVEER